MDAAIIHRLPKVIVHEHLDGGLRPRTVVELAERVGHRLPSEDPDELARWFVGTARAGGLSGYLATFEHTIAVLQTAEAIERVAYEAAEDLAADSVVHAEIRFAPELNTRAGLTIDDAIEAALGGFGRAMATFPIGIGLIVDAMRNGRRSTEAARAAARWAGRGVVGFDIAGPEDGYPPSHHLEAFEIARAAGLGITIHAGESAGLGSIGDAVGVCGADRIGHGLRIIDDIDGDALGPVATDVRDRGLPLELCPRSNVDTGAVDSLAGHPIDRLLRLGFAVTLNCDNRLMSNTGPTSEMAAVAEAFGWGADQLETVTVTAARALFLPADQRDALVTGRILPGYAAARARAR